MSASLNRVFLAGNLGHDPEPTKTRDGKPSLKLRIATNRVWRASDGTRHEDTEWHTVRVYGSQAEVCGKYLSRGRPVLVEGRLHTYSWEDGKERRSATAVIADHVVFLGGGRPPSALEVAPAPAPAPTPFDPAVEPF